eukprot:SAG22_NODE_698_length_7809_cov_2.743061_6_plen_428_part_00
MITCKVHGVSPRPMATAAAARESPPAFQVDPPAGWELRLAEDRAPRPLRAMASRREAADSQLRLRQLRLHLGAARAAPPAAGPAQPQPGLVAEAAAQPVAAAVAPRLSARRLSGRVCLVTGGASGIGKAICVRLAQEGARVAVLDTLRQPREGGADVLALMAAAREAEGIAAVDDLFVDGSVAEAAAVERAVAAVVGRWQRLDVLVNNAAKLGPGGSLTELTDEMWEAMMDVNAKGMFLCTRAAVGQFRQQAGQGPDRIRGRIVNISSQVRHGLSAVLPLELCLRQCLSLPSVAARHGKLPQQPGLRGEQGRRGLRHQAGGQRVHQGAHRGQRRRAGPHPHRQGWVPAGHTRGRGRAGRAGGVHRTDPARRAAARPARRHRQGGGVSRVRGRELHRRAQPNGGRRLLGNLSEPHMYMYKQWSKRGGL